MAVDLKLAGGSLPSTAGLNWLVEKGYRTLLDLRESSEVPPSFIAEVTKRVSATSRCRSGPDRSIANSRAVSSSKSPPREARPLYFLIPTAPARRPLVHPADRHRPRRPADRPPRSRRAGPLRPDLLVGRDQVCFHRLKPRLPRPTSQDRPPDRLDRRNSNPTNEIRRRRCGLPGNLSPGVVSIVTTAWACRWLTGADLRSCQSDRLGPVCRHRRDNRNRFPASRVRERDLPGVKRDPQPPVSAFKRSLRSVLEVSEDRKTSGCKLNAKLMASPRRGRSSSFGVASHRSSTRKSTEASLPPAFALGSPHAARFSCAVLGEHVGPGARLPAGDPSTIAQ